MSVSRAVRDVFIFGISFGETVEIIFIRAGHIEIRRTHFLMMFGCMVFCKIVSFVEFAFSPQHVELFLFDAIAYPVESHVNGFGPFLFNGVIGNAGRGAVVGNNGGGGLGMAHFFKADS